MRPVPRRFQDGKESAKSRSTSQLPANARARITEFSNTAIDPRIWEHMVDEGAAEVLYGQIVELERAMKAGTIATAFFDNDCKKKTQAAIKKAEDQLQQQKAAEDALILQQLQQEAAKKASQAALAEAQRIYDVVRKLVPPVKSKVVRADTARKRTLVLLGMLSPPQRATLDRQLAVDDEERLLLGLDQARIFLAWCWLVGRQWVILMCGGPLPHVLN